MFNSYIKEKVKKYYLNAFFVDIGGSDYMRDMYQITRFTPEALIKYIDINIY